MNYKKHIGDGGGRDYFGKTVGVVTKEQLKKYIEDQSDEPGAFKVGMNQKKQMMIVFASVGFILKVRCLLALTGVHAYNLLASAGRSLNSRYNQTTFLADGLMETWKWF